MRNLLIFIAIVVLYYAIKAVVTSAVKGYHGEHQKPRSLEGEEMVLDPECRTYVVKDRAITRRIKGKTCFFCSDACAHRYAEKQ